jgi:hypothetical protein
MSGRPRRPYSNVDQKDWGIAVKIDREELYQRVWQTPMTKLAKEFDISDVGLAKACRKNAIPLPPIGYWTMVKHGKAVPKPQLPKKGQAAIELDARRHRSPASMTKRSDSSAFQVDVQHGLPVEQLSPFTAATRQKLLKGKPDGDGFVRCVGPGLFDCRIGAAATDTACRLLDAIEKALPRANLRLVKSADCLGVEHEGQTLTFRLTEQCSREEFLVRDKYYKGSESKEYVYTFAGTFSLEINGYFEGRKRWTDGKRASLSKKLGYFVLGLVGAAPALKRRATELEEQKRRWQEEDMRRTERERERRAVDEFKQQLLAEAKASQESEMMLAYIRRVEAHLLEKTGEVQQVAKEWLDAAKRIAHHVDPFALRVLRFVSDEASELTRASAGARL